MKYGFNPSAMHTSTQPLAAVSSIDIKCGMTFALLYNTSNSDFDEITSVVIMILLLHIFQVVNSSMLYISQRLWLETLIWRTPSSSYESWLQHEPIVEFVGTRDNASYWRIKSISSSLSFLVIMYTIIWGCIISNNDYYYCYFHLCWYQYHHKMCHWLIEDRSLNKQEDMMSDWVWIIRLFKVSRILQMEIF